MLTRAIARGAAEAEMLAALEAAHTAGADRRAMYDTLHALYADGGLHGEVEARVEDVLDRLWGFCPRHRLLFPALPVLTDATADPGLQA